MQYVYLQYFCGYTGYDDSKPPFDPSLMVYFRKRLTPEILGEINEIIVSKGQAEKEKRKEEEVKKSRKSTKSKKDDNDDHHDDDDGGNSGMELSINV